MTDQLKLEKEIIIYIPSYNCEDHIDSVLRKIPDSFWNVADVLVVDNHSEDKTVAQVLAFNLRNSPDRQANVVRPVRNIGYAGSQKFAYQLALQFSAAQWVIMLHGDGQYAPELLERLTPFFSSDYGIVCGYRSKRRCGEKEETPLFAFLVITFLSVLESLLTMCFRREWHSGFVMHSRRFLSEIEISELTDTRHIDGQMLFAASVVGEKVKEVPIYKRYKGYAEFAGWERIKYVIHVLTLAVSFRFRAGRIPYVSRSTTPLLYDVVTEELPNGGLSLP